MATPYPRVIWERVAGLQVYRVVQTDHDFIVVEERLPDDAMGQQAWVMSREIDANALTPLDMNALQLAGVPHALLESNKAYRRGLIVNNHFVGIEEER